MKFQEIVSPSLKDLFISQIETMILQGALKAGEKLPNERELARQMKVSRSIINSGMQELADKSFIRIIPRQGAYVEDYIRNGNIRTLTALVRGKGMRFDPELLRSLIEFRRDLETNCAHLAARNRTSEQLRELKEQIEVMEKSAGTDDFLEASITAHKLIFLATGNLVYPLIYNAFYEPLLVVTEQLLRLLDSRQILENLTKVIAAVERKEPEQAESLMREHVDLCAGILTKHYAQLTRSRA